MEAINNGDTARAGAIFETVLPESPNNSEPTVASCTGISLGLLDEWLSGQHPDAPANLAEHTKLPTGHSFG
jgi:hypothetical protein